MNTNTDKPLVGTHIGSDPANIILEAMRGQQLGCNIVQLFVELSSKNINQYKLFKTFIKKNNISCVVHISYTINCSKDWTHHSWWVKQFIMEIEMAYVVGAFAVVVHLGKQLDLSMEESLNNMYSALLFVHQQTRQTNIKILIETSTGQGSEICYKLEKLAHFYNKISKHKNVEIQNRFGICVDTCHIFAAGYDISSKNAINIFLDKFNELIGLEHIKLIHLNDSKKELGTHVDRHENIGKGFIGKTALKIFADTFKDLFVPIILETPYDHHSDDLDIIL